MRDDESVGVKAGIDTHEPHEAPPEQAGPDQQHHSHRDLDDDERTANPVGGAAALGSPALRERRAHVAARAAPRRNEAERKRRHPRDAKGEEEHAPIEADAFDARNVGRPQYDERLDAGECERESTGAAGKRQHRRLDEHLLNESRSARAQRDANRHLALAGSHACHEEIHDVRAGDEQQDTRRAEQKIQCGFDRSGDLVLQWNDRSIDGIRVCAELRLEPAEDAGNILLRLFDGHAVLQPANGVSIVSRPARVSRIAAGEEDVGAGWKLDVRRQHANDRDGAGVGSDRRSHRGPRAGVLALPEAIADDDRRWRVRLLFVGEKEPPRGRPRAEYVEEPRRHPRRERAHPLAIADQRGARLIVDRQRREAVIVLLQVEEVWIGEMHLIAPGRHLPHLHDPVGVRIRERP